MPDLSNKDDEQHPIAPVWRTAFKSVVSALAAGDFELTASDGRVRRPSERDVEQLRQNVADYGDVTLIELPDASWESSVSMWMGGSWQCLIDLWTAEEGRSDLVLNAEVREIDGDYRFEIHGVWVP